jgi:predicted alpha/beta-fold hydrolase
LKRLRERVVKRHAMAPRFYPLAPLAGVKSIRDFDHLYTARIFGFGTADRYYETQSSRQFLERIRVPTLLLHAKDDPLVPFSSYQHPAVGSNPRVQLVELPHGGHLGFLARGAPRFWLDDALRDWMLETLDVARSAQASLQA